MFKYLPFLLVLSMTGLGGATPQLPQLYCSKDKGEESSAFNGGSAEIFCTHLEIQNGDLVGLKNQTVANDDIFFVEFIYVNGNVHETTLNLFPKVQFVLVYKSNITGFSLKSDTWHLDITNSTFPKVTSDVLRGCKEVITLGFMSNPGLEFESGAFKELKNLAYLVIINQTIPRLYRGFLEGQEHLENLILNLNHLSTIDEDTFIDLSNLEQINLDDNPIEYFKPNISRLTKLTTLSLTNTKLKEISLDVLFSISQLNHLDLPTTFLLNSNTSVLLSMVPKHIGVLSKDLECPEVKPVLDKLKHEGFRISSVRESYYLKNLVRPAIC